MSVPFVRFWSQVRWQEMFVIKFSTKKFYKYPLCGSWVFICMMLRRRDRLCDSDGRSAEKRTGLDILHLAPECISVYFILLLQKKNLVISLDQRSLIGHCKVQEGLMWSVKWDFKYKFYELRAWEELNKHFIPMLAPSCYRHENLADRRESPARLTAVAWQNSLYCGHTAEFRVLLATQFLFLTSKCSQKEI